MLPPPPLYPHPLYPSRQRSVFSLCYVCKIFMLYNQAELLEHLTQFRNWIGFCWVSDNVRNIKKLSNFWHLHLQRNRVDRSFLNLLLRTSLFTDRNKQRIRYKYFTPIPIWCYFDVAPTITTCTTFDDLSGMVGIAESQDLRSFYPSLDDMSRGVIILALGCPLLHIGLIGRLSIKWGAVH